MAGHTKWSVIKNKKGHWPFGSIVSSSGTLRAMVVANHGTYAEVVFLPHFGSGSVPRGPQAIEQWTREPEPES